MALGLACSACRPRPISHAGPWIVAAHGPTAVQRLAHLETGCAIAPEARHQRGAALSLAGLPRGEPEALAAVFDSLTERLRARSQLFMVDLDDEALEAGVTRWITARRPTLDAAHELAEGCWKTADASVAVAVVTRCPAASAGLRCTAPWGSDGASLSATERFLAGTLTRALVLRGVTAADAAAARRALRARVLEVHSDVALVVPETGDELARAWNLADAARRTLDLLPRGDDALREGIASVANARPGEDPLPWLPRDPRRVVVIPRASAFIAPERFRREVRDRLRDAGLAARVAEER